MRENPMLVGLTDRFDLEFAERQATLELVMKLGIQFHLGGLSLSNTVSVLEIFGVERARSTVHDWVYKAELGPDDG
jgi:putative transposase